MTRLARLLFICIVAWTACPGQVTYTVPGSQPGTIFNAVGAATISGCLQNQGQTVWFSNYVLTGTPTAIQYRLEFSYNSDAATCTTGTWFPMSDDAIELTQGEVVGIGAYPFVRANLLKCVGCGGGVTLTATYSTTSATPGLPFGFYNPSQQVRKTIFVNGAGSSASLTSSGIVCPYGSAAGFIMFSTNGALPAGAAVQVVLHYGQNTVTLSNFTLPTPAGAFLVSIPEPATAATTVDVTYSSAGGGNKLITAYYYFFPPGTSLPYGSQPMSLANIGNSEATSAANTAVSTSLEIPSGANGVMRAYLFSVSARCSAGTAQLTVTDGSTSNSIGTPVQIWSTAATEVGTTTFKFQWNPGLASSPGNGIKVTLGTCGVANTGTLDVQGSVF